MCYEREDAISRRNAWGSGIGMEDLSFRGIGRSDCHEKTHTASCASPVLYWIIGRECRNVLFNRITASALKPMGSLAAWKPRMAALYWPVGAPVAARNSRSATKGSLPSQVFRNVSACCDRRISEESMTKERAFPVLFSPRSAFASPKPADRALDLQHPGRSARPWRATGSSGVSATPCGFNWNG